MQRPRRLLAAQEDDSVGEHRGNGRGHGEAGPDGERKNDEDNSKVGEPLHNVIGRAFCFRWPLERRDIGPGRQQVATEMPGDQSANQVDQAHEDNCPGRLKVEETAPAILVRQDEVVAGRDRGAGGRDGNHEQGLHGSVARFTPVKPGMRDQDLDTGDEEREEAEHRQPVRETDYIEVPGRIGIGHFGIIAPPGTILVGEKFQHAGFARRRN